MSSPDAYFPDTIACAKLSRVQAARVCAAGTVRDMAAVARVEHGVLDRQRQLVDEGGQQVAADQIIFIGIANEVISEQPHVDV